jgi:hypothetical protein
MEFCEWGAPLGGICSGGYSGYTPPTSTKADKAIAAINTDIITMRLNIKDSKMKSYRM